MKKRSRILAPGSGQEEKETRSIKSFIKVTAPIEQSVHEKLLDHQYATGLSVQKIVQEALAEYLEQKQPAARPEMVKENRPRMGRPPKRTL